MALVIGLGVVASGWGGPLRYAQGLARALAETGGNRYVVFTNRPSAFTGAGVEVVEVPSRGGYFEPLWDQLWLPLAARKTRLDLYHGVKGALPAFLDCAQVATVHDLAVHVYPESFSRLQRAYMRFGLRLAVKKASRILTDSAHTKDDLLRFYGVPPERVVTVPLGVCRRTFFPAEPGCHGVRVRGLEFSEPFFLYAGTVQPRKNVDLVVEAFGESGLYPRARLVVAGRLRPGYHPFWLREPLPGLHYLGPVADDTLADLYRRALALVSPSSYEGFGLTLLEAMASGCPVLALPTSSVPEVLGDAGFLLPEASKKALAEGMRRIFEDPGLRRSLRARGLERSLRFDWRETARRTAEVYHEVAAK
ncbi:MAG: glycosyl transferase family 1 [Candidatus Binatia bacterium]|nr:MAG: glycosyl transferase family 1 [Candidatus Binatia bacterium]